MLTENAGLLLTIWFWLAIIAMVVGRFVMPLLRPIPIEILILLLSLAPFLLYWIFLLIAGPG